jgi:protein ImuB
MGLTPSPTVGDLLQSVARATTRKARYLVCRFADFAIERCGFDASEVVGLLTLRQNADRLVAVSSAAEAVGWRVGMSAPEARALWPEGALEPWDEIAESIDRDALLRTFLAISDSVAAVRRPGRFGLDGFEAIVLEVQSSAHLFGGEPGALAHAHTLAARCGHRAQIVLADCPTGALALARDLHRQATEADPAAPAPPAQQLVPAGGLAAALRELPLSVLDLSPTLEASLRTVGLRRIGELARLEPSSISSRFGAEGLRFHRVARGLPPEPSASGGAGPTPRAPPTTEPISVGATFAGPTETLAPILFVLPGLVAQLCERLEAQERAVVRLCVRLGVERGGFLRVHIRCGRPTLTPAVLTRLIRARLESLTPSSTPDLTERSGAFLDIALIVEASAGARSVQPGLLERAEAVEPLPEILARLTDLLGESAVFRPELLPRWRPEAAWRPVAADGSDPPFTPAPTRRDPAEPHHAREADLPLPRPTLLLPRPEPIQLSGAPWSTLHRERETVGIRRQSEPEYLCGEWWMPDGGFHRTYYALTLEDGRDVWVYEDATGAWLHGWFD